MQEQAPARQDAAFYPVGTEKFIQLTLFSFGLYAFWWTFKQWQTLQQKGEDVNPLARTVLSVIWQYDLYQRIASRARTERQAHSWKPVRLHVMFVAFTLIPLWLLATDHPWGLLINMMTLLPNLLASQTIDAINEKYLPLYAQNTELSGGSWAVIVAGIIGWLTLLTLALTTDF